MKLKCKKIRVFNKDGKIIGEIPIASEAEYQKAMENAPIQEYNDIKNNKPLNKVEFDYFPIKKNVHLKFYEQNGKGKPRLKNKQTLLLTHSEYKELLKKMLNKKSLSNGKADSKNELRFKSVWSDKKGYKKYESQLSKWRDVILYDPNDKDQKEIQFNRDKYKNPCKPNFESSPENLEEMIIVSDINNDFISTLDYKDKKIIEIIKREGFKISPRSKIKRRIATNEFIAKERNTSAEAIRRRLNKMKISYHKI